MKKLMDGNEAGAWAARLADVKVFPNFPVTPQTEPNRNISPMES